MGPSKTDMQTLTDFQRSFILTQLKKNLKIEILSFMKYSPNFSLWEWKRDETKVVEKFSSSSSSSLSKIFSFLLDGSTAPYGHSPP